MKKSITWLSIGTITSAAVAGAAIGLYTNQKSKNHTNLLDYHLSDINEKLNSLPSFEDQLSDEEFFDYIDDNVQNHGKSIVETITGKMEEDLDEITVNFNEAITEYVQDHSQNLEDVHAAINLYKEEVDRHKTNIETQIDQYNSGYIGTHDLNYYNDAIHSRLEISQFHEFKNIIEDQQNGSTESIDALKSNMETMGQNFEDTATNIHSLISSIDLTTGDLKNSLSAFETSFAAFQDSTHGQVTNLENSLSTYFNAHNDLKDYSVEISNRLNGELARLDTIIGEASTISEEGTGIIGDIEKANTEIKSNALQVEELRVIQTATENSLADISEIINSMQASIFTLGDVIEKNKNESDQKWMDLSNQFNTFTTSFNDTLNLNTANINANTSKLQDLTAKLDNVITSTDEVRKDIETLSVELQDAKIIFNNIEGVANQNQLDINYINQVISEMTLQLQQWTSSIGQNSDDIASLKIKVDGISPKITSLEGAISDQGDAILGIEASIHTTEDLMAGILNDIDALSMDATAQQIETYDLGERVAVLENKESVRTIYEVGPQFGLSTIHNNASNALILPIDESQWSSLSINLWKYWEGTYATSILFSIPKEVKTNSISTSQSSTWRTTAFFQNYYAPEFGTWFKIRYEYDTNKLYLVNIGHPIIAQVVATMR